MKKLIVPALSALALGTVLAVPAHADTVCGYNPAKVVAVGPTSCPFAMAVANQMMSGAGTTFWANSPVTGDGYQMHCMIEQHGSTTCRDVNGGGATVVIY